MVAAFDTEYVELLTPPKVSGGRGRFETERKVPHTRTVKTAHTPHLILCYPVHIIFFPSIDLSTMYSLPVCIQRQMWNWAGGSITGC